MKSGVLVIDLEENAVSIDKPAHIFFWQGVLVSARKHPVEGAVTTQRFREILLALTILRSENARFPLHVDCL